MKASFPVRAARAFAPWYVMLGVVTGGALACSDEANDASGGATGNVTGAGGGAGQTMSTFAQGNTTTGGPVTCTVPCMTGEICSHGACVPQQTCTRDDDCDYDTYCDETTGLCQPWEGVMPPFDDKCLLASTPGILAPRVKCEFSAAPAGDPFPDHVDVQGTPVVVNFNDDANLGPPSIVATFTATIPNNYSENLGVIRVLRGDTCEVEANIGGTDYDGDGDLDYVVSSSSLAVGDLDGDTMAEIVAYGDDGSTLAFTRKNGVWSLLWKAPLPAGALWSVCDTGILRCPLGWAGASLHDIDDDGKPEVIREGFVFSSTGALLSPAPAGYTSYSSGQFPVLANMDGDASIEMTNGRMVWEWSGGAWVAEAGFPGANASIDGHPAVADFGAFGAGLPADYPEIAVVGAATVRVHAMDGSFAMPPVAVPGENPGGGPPTISDFDGDGQVEVGVAGRAFYTVFDIDCGPTPRPGGVCNLGPCDFAGGTCPAMGYILWSRSTQDISSNVTGSSIFDFEADGASEVVYGDECFVRVYDGRSGEVLFSQYRSSCTWNENPIIADTDGNFRANLVTPSNKACSPDGSGIACQTLNADGVDPQFNGVKCQTNADCVSAVCDEGLCRCMTGADCCAANDDAACLEEGFACAPPNPGTLGTGNTCRAAHPHGLSGIRVYSDANDAWVRSRTIWSQHAYAVTHINEDGTIPQTSQWIQNWKDPTLNNFRQNVPGDPNGQAIPDPTAGASDFSTCDGAEAKLTVDICNRGSGPVGAGVVVGFYDGATLACSAVTSVPLDPGQCTPVSCTWTTPPNDQGLAVDIDVVVNDGGGYAECKPGNNAGLIRGVFCKPPA